MRTGKQIEHDIWMMLKDSILGHSITGEVYHEGFRPRNSVKEDAVVIFTSGLADEIQTGVVTINLYVPDLDLYGNGQMLEDLKRTTELEIRAKEWVEGLTCDISEYRFKLRQAIMTDKEPSIHQHFVVIKLGFEYYAGDDGDKGSPLLSTQEGNLVQITPGQLRYPQGHAIECD